MHPHIQSFLKACHRRQMDVWILESSIIVPVMDDEIPLLFYLTFSLFTLLLTLEKWQGY